MAGRHGESLAAALTAAGVRILRETRSGSPRGMFCGMGVCQDCLVQIDGRRFQRACMTKLEAPIAVRRESFEQALPVVQSGEAPKLVDAIPEEQLEVLIIGAGPAGLAAGIAAKRAGADVCIVDERQLPGGQYFKQLAVDCTDLAPADRQHSEGTRLIDEARCLGVPIRSSVEIWGVFSPNELIGTERGTVRRFNPQRLVVATGAYERGVPIPGWTLPGVMTTGAAQTLWRSYRRLPGQKVLLAGHGPLNLQVASELAFGGAEIAAVIELAPMEVATAVKALPRMLAAAPGLVRDGARYRARLRGVTMIYGSVVTRILKTTSKLIAHVGRYPRLPASSEEIYDADAICLGYGFQPSNEILRALGAAQMFDERRNQFTTVVDDVGRTSVESVFAVGDCTGLVGARAALSQGTVTGAAVAQSLGHRRGVDGAAFAHASRDLARHRRFQKALWELYAAPHLTLELADSDTVICRCEEVTLNRILAALSDGQPSIGDLKRATRAGMGSCQGRYCGPLLARTLAERQGRVLDESIMFAPRMPVKPVAIADIARSITDA